MLDQSLVDILACPETQQSLMVADQELVDHVNQAIVQGQLKNRDQKKCDQQIDALLVREDKQYAYPVLRGIPVLIVEEGIALAQIKTVS